MKQLSIIIPVYNVEKYIRTCIESLYRQGLNEECFEVIIVNDGTRDRSMDVIADIVQKHSNIIIIEQENQGLSMARNNGLAKASGEYILFVDSDDLLIDNSLPPLLEKALETKVDLIVADYLAMQDKEISELDNSSLLQKNKFEFKEKTGRQLFLEFLNPHQCNVWRTLYLHEFLLSNELYFIPGIMFEDVPFTHKAYLKASLCILASWNIYIYRYIREGAITNLYDMKKFEDLSISIGKTWELAKTEELSQNEIYKLEDSIYASVIAMSYTLLYTFGRKSERKQVILFLREKILGLKFTHNLKQRIDSLLFWHSASLYITYRDLIRQWNRWKRR